VLDEALAEQHDRDDFGDTAGRRGKQQPMTGSRKWPVTWRSTAR
jgi:hypothetical protein